MPYRTSIALLLIILCLVARFGDSVFFHIGREQVRASQLRIIARLEGDHVFDRISESEAMFWIEKDREFILDGKMYDVVEIREKDGVRQFLVIPDEREKELLDRYLSASQNDPSSTGFRAPLSDPFSGIWMQVISTHSFRHAGPAQTRIRAVTGPVFPISPYIAVPVPPPLG